MNSEKNGVEKSMDYYLTKRKKANRSYWYVFFTDPEDSQKILKSMSVEKLRRLIGINTRTPLTREKEAYAVVERAISDGLINLNQETKDFGQYVCDFWDFDTSSYIRRRNQKSPNSIGKDYARTMKANFEKHVLPYLPKKLDIAQVSSLTIEKVIDELLEEGKLANATIQKVVQSVAVPLKEATRRKLVAHNPMDGVEPISSSYRVRGIFTIEEIQGALDYLYRKGTVGVQEIRKVRGPAKTTVEKSFLVRTDLKPYLAVALSAFTGMRSGEVRALCSEQIEIVNDEFGIIEVDRAYNDYAGNKSTKGKRNRKVPVSKELCDQLLDMAAKNPHPGSTRVFWSEASDTKPIADSYILKQFYRAISAVGISESIRKERKLDFHSLRHTINSTMRGKIPDKSLRAVIGHESEQMTERYTHETDEEILAVGSAVKEIFK
jgi:integrase